MRITFMYPKEWFNLKDYKTSPDMLVEHGLEKALHKRLHVQYKHRGGFDLRFALRVRGDLYQLCIIVFVKCHFNTRPQISVWVFFFLISSRETLSINCYTPFQLSITLGWWETLETNQTKPAHHVSRSSMKNFKWKEWKIKWRCKRGK